MGRRVALLGMLLGAAFGVCELACGQGAAQVQWRHDYNAPRKEAEAKGLPIFPEF